MNDSGVFQPHFCEQTTLAKTSYNSCKLGSLDVQRHLLPKDWCFDQYFFTAQPEALPPLSLTRNHRSDAAHNVKQAYNGRFENRPAKLCPVLFK